MKLIAKEKIPLKPFTLAQICTFSNWQYFYAMGLIQHCVMRFIKPVDWLFEYHLRRMRSYRNLRLSKWTESLEYEFTPYKLALFITNILSQISLRWRKVDCSWAVGKQSLLSTEAPYIKIINTHRFNLLTELLLIHLGTAINFLSTVEDIYF